MTQNNITKIECARSSRLRAGHCVAKRSTVCMDDEMETGLLFCVLCLLVNHSFAQWAFDDDGCRTPDKAVGNCISVHDCRPMVTLLATTKKPYTQEFVAKVQAYTCGYEDNRVKVCCPSGPINLGQSSNHGQHSSSNEPRDVSNHQNVGLLPTDCGYLDTTDRIINGEDASLNEFPWMALLAYRSSTGQRFKCGGAIINKNYILTAAHCISNLRDPPVSVRVGEHDTSKTTDCELQEDAVVKCAPPVQNVRVQKIIVHPEYDTKTFQNDIGLLRVSQIDVSRENSRPVCLPVGNQRTAKYNNVIVTGWGITENHTTSDILQKVTVRVVSSDECQKAYDKYNIKLTSKQVCAGGKNKMDSCSGDSGGPMHIAAYLNNENRYVQQGIVSFGPRACGSEGLPGVYTAVPYYMDWILDNLKP